MTRAPARAQSAKRAHLETLRRITRRMAAGSTLLRVWTVLLVAALLAVAAIPPHTRFAWLAVFLTIVLWLLDAHFVRQARLFRKVRDRARATPADQLELVLDTKSVETESDSYRSVLFSKAPLAYYASVLVATALFGLAIHS